MILEEDKNKSFLKKYRWSIGQLFPELIHPGHQVIEDNFNPRTHIFTSNFNDNVQVWEHSQTSVDNVLVNTPNRKGTLWIYCAPCNDILTLTNAEDVNANTILKHKIFYSSSNGPLPVNDANEFHWNEISMNDGSKHNASVNKYKNIRVTSAAIILKQICPEKDRSGILRIGYSYKGLIEEIKPFKFEDFDQNFALSKTVNMASTSEVVCRYRIPFGQSEKFGPYDPTESMPYFFILGEGLPLGSSIEVNVIRHFEGIPMYIYRRFTHQDYAPTHSASYISQKKLISDVASGDNTIEEYSNNMPPEMSSNSKPANDINELVDIIKEKITYNVQLNEVYKKVKNIEISNIVQEHVEQMKSKLDTLYGQLTSSFNLPINKKEYYK